MNAFATSRVRYGKKLVTSIPDDHRRNRYYVRDVIAPRFFRGSLDDYVRAVSNRDWVAARAARDAVHYFSRFLRDPAGVRWKFLLISGPRRFRWLLRLNNRLPRPLRPTTNPTLQLRPTGHRSGDEADLVQ
jgi:hypothetical protein